MLRHIEKLGYHRACVGCLVHSIAESTENRILPPRKSHSFNSALSGRQCEGLGILERVSVTSQVERIRRLPVYLR